MSELCGCASVNVINLLGMECHHDGIMGNGKWNNGSKRSNDDDAMMRPMRCDASKHHTLVIMEHFFSSLIKKQHLNRQVL
jgi:hypothetical protein